MKKKLLYLLLASFWLLIIIPKGYFFVFSLLLSIVCLLNFKLNKDKIFYSIFLLFILHLISIFFYALKYECDWNRIAAALNTSMCWLLAAIIYGTVSRWNIKNKYIIIQTEKIVYFNLLLVLVLSLIGFLFYKYNVSFSFINRYLYQIEWVNGKTSVRLNLLFEYCSLVTCFILLNISLLLKTGINKKKQIIMLSMLIPVYFTKSRICLLAYLIYIFLIYFPAIKKFLLNYKKLVFILLSSFIVIIVLFKSDFLFSKLYSILYQRENSTVFRFDLYSSSLNYMWNSSPLIGMGVKEIFSNDIPFGSHSTYIGALYKLGIIGGILSLFLLINIWKLVRSNNSIVDLAVFSAIVIISIFEDIDGTNWLVFYCFFYLALVKSESIYKEKNFSFKSKLLEVRIV